MTAWSLPRARHGAFALIALLSACGPEAAAPAELLPWMLGYKSDRNNVGVWMEEAYAFFIYVREDGTGFYAEANFPTSHETVDDQFQIEAIPHSRDEFWVVRAEEQPDPRREDIREEIAWRFRRGVSDCGPFERVRVDRSSGEPITGEQGTWWAGKLCVERIPGCEPDPPDTEGAECDWFVWCEDGLPPDGCPGGPPVTSHNVP